MSDNLKINIGEHEFNFSDVKTALEKNELSVVDEKQLNQQIEQVKANFIKTEDALNAEKKAQYKAKQEEREAFYRKHGYEKSQGETASELGDRAFADLFNKLNSPNKEESKEDAKPNEFELKYSALSQQFENLQSEYKAKEELLKSEKESAKKIRNEAIFEKHWTESVSPNIDSSLKGKEILKLAKDKAKSDFLNQFDDTTEMTFDGINKSVFIKDGEQARMFNPDSFLTNLSYINDIKGINKKQGIEKPYIDPSKIDKKGAVMHQILPNPSTQNEVFDYAVSKLGLQSGSKEMQDYIAQYPSFDTLQQV